MHVNLSRHDWWIRSGTARKCHIDVDIAMHVMVLDVMDLKVAGYIIMLEFIAVECDWVYHNARIYRSRM